MRSVTPENRTPAPTDDASPVPGEPTARYEIRVAGRLPARWSAWFDGLTVTADADGTTVLCGAVVDQSGLHGLIQKLRDLGVPLISLTRLAPDAHTEPQAHPTQGDPT